MSCSKLYAFFLLCISFWFGRTCIFFVKKGKSSFTVIFFISAMLFLIVMESYLLFVILAYLHRALYECNIMSLHCCKREIYFSSLWHLVVSLRQFETRRVCVLCDNIKLLSGCSQMFSNM